MLVKILSEGEERKEKRLFSSGSPAKIRTKSESIIITNKKQITSKSFRRLSSRLLATTALTLVLQSFFSAVVA